MKPRISLLADPTGVKDRTLALSRVTIPAHRQLALHRHPGTQARLVRRVSAGQTGTVHAGEWVIERPSSVHFGANNGDHSLVILLATLFTNGSPPSIPVSG